MTTAAKKPQDNKSGENFKFEHDGTTYQFEKSLDILRKPGFIRKHRKLDPNDLLFTLLEEVAGEKALEAIDNMEPEEFEAFNEELEAHIESVASASLGES